MTLRDRVYDIEYMSYDIASVSSYPISGFALAQKRHLQLDSEL